MECYQHKCALDTKRTYEIVEVINKQLEKNKFGNFPKICQRDFGLIID